ncbi:uncharacterized protein A1O9_07272 [Exophiala aquamarina CBS 119918]|uniref:AB hydrolase-1 domain-containing protein n=1 Tax=Exophiala aquamarina CBS 119918 TaxID=1182545 RepID=A0A072PBD5_9EURO|nr:uncharacterized protein A1O9_07272 [Exophiala aquamarina CBS 119918]KEF57082.1 hypothetical protein A1O9_07272 [Exophiala aquamarina CBS 119918]
MSSFRLTLEDSSVVTGKTYFELDRKYEFSSKTIPLLVCVPGGAYDSDYFDFEPKHSLRSLSKMLGIPVVCVDRPGYGESTDVSNIGNTFIQRHGRWLNNLVLPSIWKEFSASLNASSIVLYGESIGGAVSTVAAGMYASDPPAYPLSGLVLSAMSTKPQTQQLTSYFSDESLRGKPIHMPFEQRISHAAGDNPELFDPVVFTSRKGMSSTSVEELYDINIQWPTYYAKYAEKITVQVQYSMGEYDQLWHINRDTMNEFTQSLKNSFWVEARFQKNAPHCIEFSYQCTAFYLRVFGFAMECSDSYAIDEERKRT